MTVNADVQKLIDEALAAGHQTTVGYINKHWKTPPAGTQWAAHEAKLKQARALLDVAVPPVDPPPPSSGDVRRQWGFSNGGYVLSKADYQLAVGIGASWARTDVRWRDTQPASGSFNWSTPDGLVASVAQAGGKSILCLTDAPGWAARNAAAQHAVPSPAHYGDWAAWCAAVVARYAPQGVTHYEIWNEPNLAGFWDGNPQPDVYTAMLKSAYPAMHAAAAKAGHEIFVLSAGLAPAGGYTDAAFQVGKPSVNKLVYLEAMYRSGAAGFFDALGDHPYGPAGNPLMAHYQAAPYQVENTSPSLRSLMVANGDGSKLIHATESGCKSSAGDQTAYYKAFCDWWATRPYAGVHCAYLFREGINPGEDPTFGLRTPANQAKPAWGAYADRIKALGTGAA